MDTRRDNSASLATPLNERTQSLPLAAEPLTPPTKAAGCAAVLPLPAGRAFGRYLLLREIAAGGMGVVYEAHDPMLDRVVALKMIRGGVLAGPTEIARFDAEAKAAAHLAHPHIVQVYDSGAIDGQPFFTMAFAPGGSLARRFEEFAGKPAAAVPLVEKVARAVAYAHSKGILHRDLKPGNVLLGEGDEPLVSDFGLAKFLDASLELTITGQRLGTPAYMAPEQASGQTGRIGPPSDVWALGVVLYQLLTGVRPFNGETAEVMTRQILTTDPLSPRSVKPGLDRALETVVLKCLEKDPSRRYGSAEALADDLARWQRGEAVRAKALSLPRRTWRAVRQQPIRLVGVVGLGVVLAVLALMWWRDPERQRQAMEGRLAEGESVTLVKEFGPPVWSRKYGGAGETVVSKQPDEPFGIRAPLRTLVELMPHPPLPRFRFRAEVLHLDGGRDGEVGLYVGHSMHLAANGDKCHCFAAFCFNDAVRVASWAPKKTEPSNFMALRLYWWRSETQGEGYAGRAHLGLGRLFVARGDGAGAKTGPWRKVAIEFEPTTIRTYWNGELVDSVSRLQMLKIARNAKILGNNGPAAVQPDYLPEEGIGLFVDQASVLFRRVVIEPLEAGR